MPPSDATENSTARFVDHELRGTVLGEVHARPFYLTQAPRTFLHFAFLTGGHGAAEERAWLNRLCESRGAPPAGPASRFHALPIAGGTLRWEGHSEFSTYTWDGPLDPGTTPFSAALSDHPFGAAFRPPGPVMVAVRLELRHLDRSADPATETFDAASLCISRVLGGTTRIVTDYRQDGDGRTRILVLEDGASPQATGALVQRLLEIETYRTLALLGLPLAQTCTARIGEIEERLNEISVEIPESRGISANKDLLQILSSLAARVEAIAATSAFRFGATRAYHEIVVQRLRTIDEQAEPGYSTWAGFLSRRLNPAMRTCHATEARIEALSTRLSRAADLLRTRVDVELEQQNRDLLQSMNRRARLQLRLQQTVEGLSVAAVSYYVVGLIGYAAKGAKAAGVAVDDAIVVAASVPVVLLAIWWMVRRIRRSHGDRPAA